MQRDLLEIIDEKSAETVVANGAVREIETWCVAQGLSWVVGIDEAGRGPLAGPVVAAAVVLDLNDLEQPWLLELDDSKKLTAARREHAYDAIVQHARAYAIVSVENETIDAVNILQATIQAMEGALVEVCQKLDVVPQRVFIDGNRPIRTELAQQTVVKGDARSLHIAAASILAKVTRDRQMDAYDRIWPEYGFAKHKGYPTRAHRAAIEEHGPCGIHRLSFGGVREHVTRLRK